MAQQVLGIETAKTYLRRLLSGIPFTEVEKKSDISKGTYYLCPPQGDGHTLTLMFISKEEATKILSQLVAKKIKFKRPTGKPYNIEVDTLSAVAAHTATSEPATEIVPNIDELLAKIRADPKSGYTNNCSVKKDGVQQRGFYFKTVEQAIAAKDTVSKIAEGITVSARGLFVPRDLLKRTAIPQQKAVPKKKVSPPKKGSSEKTLEEWLAGLKDAIRSEVQREMLDEITQLEDRLTLAENALKKSSSESYVIPKNGDQTLKFSFEEIGKGILMGAEGFTIKKQLLLPFCS